VTLRTGHQHLRCARRIRQKKLWDLVKSLISRDIFINFAARERAAASGKALILKKDRRFIRYFCKLNALFWRRTT
jgi:hypothetical protein